MKNAQGRNVSVYLSLVILDVIDRIAMDEGKSRSEIIMMILESYFMTK